MAFLSCPSWLDSDCTSTGKAPMSISLVEYIGILCNPNSTLSRKSLLCIVDAGTESEAGGRLCRRLRLKREKDPEFRILRGEGSELTNLFDLCFHLLRNVAGQWSIGQRCRHLLTVVHH